MISGKEGELLSFLSVFELHPPRHRRGPGSVEAEGQTACANRAQSVYLFSFDPDALIEAGREPRPLNNTQGDGE